jgi:hypothetical protein
MSLRTATIPLFLLLAISACNHTISFNDNVLYSPNPRPDQGPLRDPGLQACLNQVLATNPELNVASVTLIACPDAGIQTLAGIEALTSLEQLEVSDNQISDLSPLASLINLRVLGIRSNALGDIRTLQALSILRFVSLQGNNGIPCRQLDDLQQRLGNTLNRPTTCVQ